MDVERTIYPFDTHYTWCPANQEKECICKCGDVQREVARLKVEEIINTKLK